MEYVLEIIKQAHLSNGHKEMLISQWVNSARDRKILRLKLIDDHTYEQIAGEITPQMSSKQVGIIVRRRIREDLLPHI